MTHYLPFPLGVILVLIMTGCGGDDVVSPPTESEVFSTTLTGYQGPSKVASPAWGEATFEVNGNSVDYELTIQDLHSATAAHIHLGSPSEAGPIAYGFFEFEPQDIDSETFTGTITESDLTPQQGVGFDGSFDAFLQRLNDGNLYVNTHSTYNPGGDIRGQITAGANNTAPAAPSPESFTASMDGSTEDVTTDAHGESTLTWDWQARELQYEVTLENIDDVTQGHIHQGETTGTVVSFFSLDVGEDLHYTSSPNGSGEEDQARSFDEETLSGTIEHTYFTDGLGGSFQQLVQLLRDGEAFINVHTLVYPGGEIGGQYGNGGNGNGNGGNDPDY